MGAGSKAVKKGSAASARKITGQAAAPQFESLLGRTQRFSLQAAQTSSPLALRSASPRAEVCNWSYRASGVPAHFSSNTFFYRHFRPFSIRHPSLFVQPHGSGGAVASDSVPHGSISPYATGYKFRSTRQQLSNSAHLTSFLSLRLPHTELFSLGVCITSFLPPGALGANPRVTFSAIDLNTGEYVWKIPRGEYSEPAAKG